jgi:mannitol/fructose-specific phosphotransferase system IIA component (Ntr-type)
MNIKDIINPSCIRVSLSSSDKTAAITELVDLLDSAGMLENRDSVLQAVLAREKTRSTGIGLGLAVPHGKSSGCRKLVMAIGKPKEPLEFGAIDSRPCQFIVLLASPIDETGPHIQALAGVSRTWQNEIFRRAVMESTSSEQLFAAIEQHS